MPPSTPPRFDTVALKRTSWSASLYAAVASAGNVVVGPARTPIVPPTLPAAPPASVAPIVKENRPAVFGTPEMTPVDSSITSPGGSAPLATVNVYGPVPLPGTTVAPG